LSVNCPVSNLYLSIGTVLTADLRLTGLNQLAVCQVMDWPTHGLEVLRTSQLAKMFDAKFGKDYRIGTARCTTSAE